MKHCAYLIKEAAKGKMVLADLLSAVAKKHGKPYKLKLPGEIKGTLATKGLYNKNLAQRKAIEEAYAAAGVKKNMPASMIEARTARDQALRKYLGL